MPVYHHSLRKFLCLGLLSIKLSPAYAPPPDYLSGYKSSGFLLEGDFYDDNWGRVVLDSDNDHWTVYGDYGSGYSYVRDLIVKKDSIIEFVGPSLDPDLYGPILNVEYITFWGDSVLFLSLDPAGSSTLGIKDHGAVPKEALRHIAISNDSGLWVPQWSLDNGYYYVVGYDGPWKALPEPSTYGAVFVAAGLGVAFLRRRGRGLR